VSIFEGLLIGELMKKIKSLEDKFDKEKQKGFIKQEYDLPKTTISVTKDLMPKEPYLQVILTGKSTKPKHENWEKVQFPAYCLFSYPWDRINHCPTLYVGVINMAWIDGNMCELHRADKQYVGLSRVEGHRSLKDLMEKYDIEILKAKLILKRD
jgi:hypothetical protein